MERYNLYLTGVVTAATATNITFDYDLKQLLPLNLRNKRFLLKSSFSTLKDWGASEYVAIQVSTNLTSTMYAKETTYTGYTRLGIGRATLFDIANNKYGYSFTESECFPVMLDYPDQDTFIIRIENSTAVFVANDTWALNLSFELIE